MLLNATLRRSVASFFLVEMIGSLLIPNLSYALMGPGQPEFTSYESAGSPDMVNLSTGDLTYNIPVLEVPGPETTFSLPLTYRAGIRPEQEASWVGLGWSMNPGSIVRNVNGYPDDSNGELAINSYSNPGHHGWYGGVPGILSLAWDSETGHSGSASLLGFVNASWQGNKLEHGDIIGVGATRGKGFTVDPMTLTTAAASVASLGATSALSVGAQVALQAAGSVAIGVGIAAFGKLGPTGGGFNRPTVNRDHTWFRTKYWVFSNDTTKEAMFGSLYFDKMSANVDTNFGSFSNPNNYGPNVYDGTTKYANNQSRKAYVFRNSRNYNSTGNFVTETAADIQQSNSPDSYGYLSTSQSPISIAHDDFNVMGPGISGSIRPQRLEVGSVAYPRNMLEHQDKYNLVSWQDRKAQFRYENSVSNTYSYSANTSQGGIAGASGTGWGSSQLVLTDSKLYDLGARVEPDRKGLVGGKLVQGKQINWFSNKELADAYDVAPTGPVIAEFAPPTPNESTDQQVFDYWEDVPGATDDAPHTYTAHYRTNHITSNNLFRRVHPQSGIGAFVITAEDGTTYHYSLPVYHLAQHTKTTESANPNDVTKGVAIQHTGGKNREAYNYATAWLLTAITGPDYIDQGVLGVVDGQDAGTWVKFSYGKFSSQFKWRQPYTSAQTNSVGQGYTFQEGAKETYYLNSISTRTHTALFVKSTRRDGRGHYDTSATTSLNAVNASNLGIDERQPSSSLRLDEIILLSNADLSSIKSLTGLSENTYNVTTGTDLGFGDSYAAVLDQNDLTANSDNVVRSQLYEKALKRIVFNYSYRLCPGTPNSFAKATSPPPLGLVYSAAQRLGKLTLESIATYGPNSIKIIPDFRFDYGYNPAYGPNNSDAYGMYTSHITPDDYSTASRDGSAWSLTKITNPLGATTEISYERDQYAYISEYSAGASSLTDQGTDAPNGVLIGDNTFDFTTQYRPGDVVHLTGSFGNDYSVTEQYIDRSGNPSDYPHDYTQNCTTPIDGNYTIATVSANSVTLTSAPTSTNGSINECIPQSNSSYTYRSSFKGYGGCTVNLPIPMNKTGGDIRVASIVTRDEENHAYVVKYSYSNEKQAGYNSTGVYSKEPEQARTQNFDFYNWFDYPSTPVMYGQTTVLRGNFTTPTDIAQREVYSFYTPRSTMVNQTRISSETQAAYPFLNRSAYISLRQQNNNVKVDLGLIGQAKSIQKYNQRGTLEFSTDFNYSNSLPNADGIANQGAFTEAALSSEFLNVDNTKDNRSVYNLNWTAKQYLPTVLQSTTTRTNNVVASTTNARYDFYSGATLETSLRNSMGDTYSTKTVPAYTLYPGMGPKIAAVGNQHMLTQTAATFGYKANGTAQPAVLAAGVQTWNNNWTSYRRYDASSDRYQADPSSSPSIFRQHLTYVWQSPRLNADGTYASFVAYNWNQSQQVPNWLKAGEVTLYDHYSRPLESKDVNGQYAAQKVGYDQSQTIAATSNARYTEFAYSGAEDQLTTGPNAGHFGGEVRREGGQQSADQAHTGQFSCLIAPANPLGISYKAQIGNSNDVGTNRTYRANVWVYNSDVASSTSNGARLYVAFNGITYKEVGIADAATKRAGNWYLLQLDVPILANVEGQQLIVGCRNAGSSNVYVDDFCFRPIDASFQASVYDPATRLLTYSLNNDNLFAHYFYDGAGKVVRVAKEVLTPVGSNAPAERVVKESSYNYAQMRTPNWLDLGNSCATDAYGNNTGYSVHNFQDVNTSSPTYGQIRTDPSVQAPSDCPKPACSGMGRYNSNTGSCETPVRTLQSCYLDADTNKHMGIYIYLYSDGSCYQDASQNCVAEGPYIIANWSTNPACQ